MRLDILKFMIKKKDILKLQTNLKLNEYIFPLKGIYIKSLSKKKHVYLPRLHMSRVLCNYVNKSCGSILKTKNIYIKIKKIFSEIF